MHSTNPEPPTRPEGSGATLYLDRHLIWAGHFKANHEN